MVIMEEHQRTKAGQGTLGKLELQKVQRELKTKENNGISYGTLPAEEALETS